MRCLVDAVSVPGCTLGVGVCIGMKVECDGPDWNEDTNVLVDESEAVAGKVDLKAEGFTKMLQDGADPTADLIALMITPYDLDIVPRAAFGDGDGVVSIEQPKPLLAATFQAKIPQDWLDGAAEGLLVIVSPDLTELIKTNFSAKTLSQCWFAQAQVMRAN